MPSGAVLTLEIGALFLLGINRVNVVQSRDLDDPQAVRQHLRNSAQAMGREDLASFDGSDTAASPKSEAQKKLDELLEYADERCRELIQACAAKNLPLPENGYELQDDQGRVCAEAELAWPAKKLAVFLPEPAKAKPIFQQRGWQVFSVGEDDNLPAQLLDFLKE